MRMSSATSSPPVRDSATAIVRCRAVSSSINSAAGSAAVSPAPWTLESADSAGTVLGMAATRAAFAPAGRQVVDAGRDGQDEGGGHDGPVPVSYTHLRAHETDS